MSYTHAQFLNDYPTEEACLDSLFTRRYGEASVCPRCNKATKFYRVKERKCYACKRCGHQLHPLADTIFHKSSTPLRSWFYAMYLFSVSKNGVAASELQRHLGVTYKTAYRMSKQIRSLMVQTGTIGGEGKIVEADETYYGGVHKGWRGPRNKTPILGVVERGGEVRSIVSKVASTTSAKDFLGKTLKINTTLHTDESRIYLWTDEVYMHESINHSLREYARGEVTTNTIEGFWSLLKRSIDGTHHRVSSKHLQLYVDEAVFRYNHRNQTVYPLLLELASQRR